MALQIALSWSKPCEQELKKLGFRKRTVYMKHVEGGGTTKQEVEKGDGQFFAMSVPPNQFVTTSWWGAGTE